MWRYAARDYYCVMSSLRSISHFQIATISTLGDLGSVVPLYRNESQSI